MTIEQYFDNIKETSNGGWKSKCPCCMGDGITFWYHPERHWGCCHHTSCNWSLKIGGATEGRIVAFFTQEGIEVRTPDIIKVSEEADVTLPKEFKTLEAWKPSVANPIYSYLESRSLNSQHIIDQAQIGYAKNGKYWGYIILPIFDPEGKLIYWQGRRFKKREPKFWNPKSSKKSEIVYQLRGSSKPKTIIVVESIFNVLTLESGLFLSKDKKELEDYVIIGTLGKGMSDYQKNRILLYEHSLKELWLALDPDALREAVDFARFVGTFAKVRIPKFPEGEDVNSLGFQKSWKLMRKAEIYDEKNHMKLLLL